MASSPSMFPRSRWHRAWNPFHQLRLLYWILLDPAKYARYRQHVGPYRARAMIGWLTSTIMWGALLIPIIGVLIDPELENTVYAASSGDLWLDVYQFSLPMLIPAGVIGWLLTAQNSATHNDSLNNLISLMVSCVTILLLFGYAITETQGANAAALTQLFYQLQFVLTILMVGITLMVWRKMPLGWFRSLLSWVALGVAALLGDQVARVLVDEELVVAEFRFSNIALMLLIYVLLRLILYNSTRLIPVLVTSYVSLIAFVISYWMIIAVGNVLPVILCLLIGIIVFVISDHNSQPTVGAYVSGAITGLLLGGVSIELVFEDSIMEIVASIISDEMIGTVAGFVVLVIARQIRQNLKSERRSILNTLLFVALPAAFAALIWLTWLGGWQEVEWPF